MSYTWYCSIFNRWYIPCALLYIRHTPCTCRIRGIGQYTNGDTWPVHIYTSDIHIVHVVYAVLGQIQPVIHGLHTFVHQTYTLYMSYTRYWDIFNHWYIAFAYLYIRHTPCTCRIHFIGPYSTGDTYPVHFYTSDIHPVHVVYAVFGCIQPVIHSLYTFKHQTYTLYISYTRYWEIFNRWYMADTLLYIKHTLRTCRIHGFWAIFNHWYIAYTLLYIRHTPCTCRIRSIGPYSTCDT